MSKQPSEMTGAQLAFRLAPVVALELSRGTRLASYLTEIQARLNDHDRLLRKAGAAAQQPADQWVRCDERLPEVGTDALVMLDCGEQDVDNCCGHVHPTCWERYGAIGTQPTHWRPLPAPPADDRSAPACQGCGGTGMFSVYGEDGEVTHFEECGICDGTGVDGDAPPADAKGPTDVFADDKARAGRLVESLGGMECGWITATGIGGESGHDVILYVKSGKTRKAPREFEGKPVIVREMDEILPADAKGGS